jgi:Zn-dependent protease/CBS domain-containing protein
MLSGGACQIGLSSTMSEASPNILDGAPNPMNHVAPAMGRRWSISIAKVNGTAVRIHFTFVLFLLWVGLAGLLTSGPAAALNTLIYLALIFVSVVLHEFGHILAARQFGVRTPEIVLLPIGGVARLERIPEQPRAEFVIALAGPAVTLLIVLGLVLWLGGLPHPDVLQKSGGMPALAGKLAYANLALLVFNLLPAFPMDGGRILRAGLAALLGHERGTRIAARVGQVAAVLFGMAGIADGNVILVLIAVFVFLTAKSESGIAELNGITSGRPASESMITNFLPLRGDSPVSEAAMALIRTEQSEFPVLDDSGRLQGFLTREGIIRALVEGGPGTPIARTMLGSIPTVFPWSRMDEIVPLLTEGASVVGVTDEDNRLLGYITWENLMEKLLVSRALDRSVVPRRR